MIKTCSVEGCLGKHHGKGYCKNHYNKGKYVSVPKKTTLICSVDGCVNKYLCKGYCNLHYHRVYKHLDVNCIGRKAGESRMKHKLYPTYCNMRQRCFNINYRSYTYYGGRGITICDRRLGIDGFSNFIKDMGERPKGYSIDRIDNNGNYEPSNCRWANAHTQQSNTRANGEYVGVNYNKKCNYWYARLEVGGVRVLDQHCKSLDEAIKLRQEAELQYIKK